ncbi:hypothetical protein ACQ0MK_05460 [Thalassospira lucentensis]|uniref:hypothetical protein n=1 Tax=Thalassospira lucentensis TaxID=168935 RepID=UPI003D2F4B4F|tara:strand:- start:113 stop:820 length:708 start_codon:yes stop_codon:yes gene_type:complete
MFKDWEYAVFWISLLVALVCLFAGVYASTGLVGTTMGVGFANFVNGFEWETVTAGLFGLTAGLAVFSSAKTQIRHSIRQRVDSDLAVAFEVDHYLFGLKAVASNNLSVLELLGESKVEAVNGINVWSIISGNGPTMREAANRAQSDLEHYDKGYVEEKLQLKREIPYDCWLALSNIADAFKRITIRLNNDRSGDFDAHRHEHAVSNLTTIVNSCEEFSQALKWERTRQIKILTEP